MQNHRILLTLVALASTAACGTATAPGAAPHATESVEAAPGPTLCADLGTLIAAARANFPDLRREDRPIEVDHEPGFEAKFVLPGAAACRILTSPSPYPDAYACDLASTASRAQAKTVVERWAAVVATCPQVAGWIAKPATEQGRIWEYETDDNHLLAVQVVTAGDDGARPTLVVRHDEI